MNGYTPTIPLKERVANLIEQIPQEYRNRAVAECTSDNPHDLERALTSYVMARLWECYPSPIDEAEPFEDAWCDSQLTNSDIAITVAKHNLDHCHPADVEYFQKRLGEEIEKSKKLGFQQW